MRFERAFEAVLAVLGRPPRVAGSAGAGVPIGPAPAPRVHDATALARALVGGGPVRRADTALDPVTGRSAPVRPHRSPAEALQHIVDTSRGY